MLADVERQHVEQTVDDPRTETREEVDDRERAFLRMAVRKRLRLRARELTPERFVTALRRVDRFVVERVQIVLHFPEGRTRRPRQRWVERGQRLGNPRQAFLDVRRRGAE